MKYRNLRIAFSAVCGVLCLLLSSPTLAQSKAKESSLPTIDEVKFAWRARHRFFQTVELNVEGTTNVSAKLASVPMEGGSQPTKDLSTGTVSRFILDDQWRLRVEQQTKQWSMKDQEYISYQTFEVFDGKRRIFMTPMGALGNAYAEIGSQKSGPFADDRFDLIPLKMVFCPMDVHSNAGIFDKAKPLTITGRTSINGEDAVRIEQSATIRDKKLTEVLFADISRDYLPLRYEFRVDDRLLQMVQINEVKKVSKWLWLPIKWNAVFKFDKASGQPMSSATEVVKSYRVSEAFDPSIFQLEIPVGAWVNDSDTEESYIKKHGGK